MTEIPDPTEPHTNTGGESRDPLGPFTDFGQFGPGMIDKRVLWQSIYWVNAEGTAFFLIDMSAQYRRNVIAYLRRRAAEWWEQELFWDAVEAGFLYTWDPEDPAIERLAERRAELLAQGALGWMESTPLMRRLRELTDDQ
jgi:hypothetical protein